MTVRVVVLSDMVRPNGAGVMALLGAQILADAGHEAVVLGGAMDAALEQQLAEQYPGSAAFTNDERALDGSVTPTDHAAFVRSVRRWLEQRLVDLQPDLLYVHNCGRILTQLDLADLSQTVPVIHTMHDEWFFTDAHYTFRSSAAGPVVRTFEPGRSESVLEHRYEHLFQIPERVGSLTAVGPSEWITQRARRVFPTLDIEPLPNAVDATLFDLQDRAEARSQLGLPTDRGIALFVGSPTQVRKGFRAFEQACRHALAPDGSPPIRLVIGGTGSVATGAAEQLLTAGPLVARLAVPTASPIGDVDIAGPGLVMSGLDRSLMPFLYGAADVLVHPSVIDNLPTVPIEAGLCGTRCLASDVGGTRETIADQADLFEHGIGAAELGERISEALADTGTEAPADRERRRARQLERFSIDVHRDALLELIERSLAGARA